MSIYNCFAPYRMSMGWSAKHRAVDFATPKGVVVRAPEDGTYVRLPAQLSRRDETAAGIWGYILFASGDRVYFCHLSKHIARSGAKVNKGQALAYTGNTGYVRPSPLVTGDPDSGMHMHTYGVRKSGIRFNWISLSQPFCRGRVSTSKGLSLRTRPSVASRRLRVIPKGVVLTALGFDGKWWKVTYDGKTGWVHAAFIK